MSRRPASLLALAAFSVLILGYLWQWRFSYYHRELLIVVYAGAALLLVWTSWRHGARGWRLDNLGPALVRFGGLAGVLSLGAAAAGWLQGSWEAPRWAMILPYLAWALVQQHVLHNFLRTHWSFLLGGPRWLAWLAAAALFACYHLPNPALVSLTLLMAFLWCALFEKHPNLPAAALGQALLTVTLVSFFKFGFIDQLEVGAGGFRFESYGDGVKVAAGRGPRGEPFVATLPGANRGNPSRVRVFDVRGRQLSEWVAFSEFDFSGEIAAGELGFGPGDELVVTPGPGPSNPARARIYSLDGELLKEVRAPGLHAGYGAHAAVACGRLYLGAGPAPRAAPRLLEFEPDGTLTGQWEFEQLGLVNGLRGTGLCADGTRSSLLAWGTDISVNPATLFVLDPRTGEERSWNSLKTTFGARVTLLRTGGETLAAAAPGPLPGYPGLVEVTDLMGGDAASFVAFAGPGICGATLAAVDVDGDGRDEIVAGEGNCPDRPATVRILTLDGEPLHEWNAYPE